MARNRKTNAAIRFVPALKALVICLLLGASSVGYVLQKNRIFDLGRQIKEREITLKGWKRDNALQWIQLRDLLSPPKLQVGIEKHGLQLADPSPDQVIWIREPTLNQQPADTATLTNRPQLMVWGQ